MKKLNLIIAAFTIFLFTNSICAQPELVQSIPSVDLKPGQLLTNTQYREDKGIRVETSSRYNTSAIGFIENKGQIVDQNYNPNLAAKYLYNGNGLNVQLRQTGFSYDTYTDVVNKTSESEQEKGLNDKFQAPPSFIRHYHRIDIELVGCNNTAQIIPENKSAAYSNYFTAGAPEGGASNVYNYQKVTFKNIYPNIDMLFFLSQDGKVEYNFIVHPGGDYTQIRLQYKGAEGIKLQDGKVLIPTSNGDMTENIPASYLAANNQPVAVIYQQFNNSTFGFLLHNYWVPDFATDLIIDPTPNLLWGTYYGGSGAEDALAIKLDASNNIYITGWTTSSSNIATAGAYQTTCSGASDVFLAKFSSNGTSLIWGTYYGGTGGEQGTAIVLDASNNIYISGFTTSTSAIATAGAYQTTNAGGSHDAFLAKFNSSGTSLLWGTYYGGTGDDESYGIALDGSNNVYITGYTTSISNIATAGAYQTTYGGGSYDAFLAKFNPTGSSLLWGTYYGGTGSDFAYGIATDASANVYITGETTSTSAIATAGAYQTALIGGQDAFLAKFNTAGTSLLWGTYYGGTTGTQASAIALDASANVYFTGFTQSTSAIATAGAYQTTMNGSIGNAFVAKLNSAGTSLIWGTYYGGNIDDGAKAIALDASDEVFITGITSSTTGIATPGAYQTTYGGPSFDGFVAKLNSTGSSLLWGTYYGGTGTDLPWGIALDNIGNPYITGETQSATAIATAGAYQTTLGAGGQSAFIAEFSGCNGAPAQPAAINGPSGICTGSTATYKIVPVAGATSYTWTLPGGWTGSSTVDSIIATAGINSGTIIVIANNPCGSSSAQGLTVTVYPLPTVTMHIALDTACINLTKDTLTGTPTGGTFSGPGVIGGNFNPNTAGSGTHLLIYTYTDLNGCTNSDSLKAIVNLCTGVNGLDAMDAQIKFYPNPFSQSENVDVNMDGLVTVTMFNVLGENVGSWQVYKGNTTINTSNVPSGVYMFRIKSKDGILNKKLVKVD
jgi:hypothetical protein